jgi:hypothetical protein
MRICSLAVVLVILTVLANGLRSGKYYESREYRWYADFEDGPHLVRGKAIDRIRRDVRMLVSAVNRTDRDPETFRTPGDHEPTDPPRLKLIAIKDDVAVVEVINAEYLTQRMGTTGADTFMAEATFTLTEHKDLSSVEFLFEEGDHASPGLYSRKDFLERWKPVGK